MKNLDNKSAVYKRERSPEKRNPEKKNEVILKSVFS